MTQKTQLQAAGDGTAVPAGYVGETVIASRDGSGDTGLTNYQWTHHSSDFVTLSPGTWILYGTVQVYTGSTTDTAYGLEVNTGTASGNNSTGFNTASHGCIKSIGPSAAYQKQSMSTIPRVVSISSNTSYYLKAYITSATGGSWFTNGATLIAVRLA